LPHPVYTEYCVQGDFVWGIMSEGFSHFMNNLKSCSLFTVPCRPIVNVFLRFDMWHAVKKEYE